MAPSIGSAPIERAPTNPQISLAYLPPTLRQTRVALVGAGVLLLGLAVVAPFAAKPLPRVIGFIPALDAIISVTDLITAGLLLAHFSITRSRALRALACGYLFSAAIVVAHGLTFPGAFSPTGNLGGSPHTNFRIYLLWHLGLPLALFAYVWLRDKGSTVAHITPTDIVATVGVTGVLALVTCLACLVLLPPVDPVAGRWLTVIAMLICIAALFVLWVFQRSALDQWLMVVVVAMIVELAITALIGGRGPRTFTLGFYTGRLFSLVTSTVVLIALLAETPRLYRLEERLNERTRIARELHDTLLQSFNALLLRLQATADLFATRPDEAKRTLDSTIDQTAQALIEGRDAVQQLRSTSQDGNDLLGAIGSLGQALADGLNGDAPAFHVEVEGTPRDLLPVTRDEIYRIACEALRNSFRHAQARRLEVEIRYDTRQLRLRIRDNGKGMDPQLLRADGLSGHYGLRGMRERAQLLGGTLTIWSEVNSGTEVDLSIPASSAYTKPGVSGFRLLTKKRQTG